MRGIQRILILITLLLSTRLVHAQDTLTSAFVEQRSYELYQKKDWSKLIVFGNKAIDKGFDYFYLRSRIGIALYEEGKYRRAEKQFLAASTFNSYDNTIKEYLYYCYLYTAQYEQARKFSKTFDKELTKHLHTDSLPAVSAIAVEYGIKSSDSSRLFQNATYFQIGLQHYIKNSVSFFHAITYFSQPELVGKVTQYEYYLGAGIPLKHKWFLAPAFHFVSNTFTPSLPPSQGFGWNPIKPAPPDINSKYYIGSFALTKMTTMADFSIGTTVSSRDSMSKDVSVFSAQYIHSLSLSIYPFGNNNFSIGGISYLHTEDNYASYEFAWSPFIYVRPFKAVGLTMSYFSNTGKNIVESNGYIVNNSYDLTISRWSVIANLTLSKHVDIYGIYQLENKKESQMNFNYQYNVIVGGIRIKP